MSASILIGKHRDVFSVERPVNNWAQMEMGIV